MYDTAMPYARLIAALLVVPFLASCQSTTAGKPPPEPAPVAAEPATSATESAPQPEAQSVAQPSIQSTPQPPADTAGKQAKTSDAVQQAAVTPDMQKLDTETSVQPAVSGGTIPGTSTAELVFLDFAGFDEDLSREMAAERAAIAVDVPAAFSLNDVPDRLDRWFYRVKETGGAVQAREKLDEGVNRTRGIVGALLDLAVSAIEAHEAEEMLRPADAYNVVVEYDKQTGKADRVLFYRR